MSLFTREDEGCNQVGKAVSLGAMPASPTDAKLRDIKVAGGRVLRSTPVFDTYWRFAAKRQELFLNRLRGEAPPWTDDPVLLAHRFTNVFRASDRVSQYLIQNVLFQGIQTGEEIFFRCLLFKLFNRIECWEALSSLVGMPSWKTFNLDTYGRALDVMSAKGQKLYSAAYIMPSPRMGSLRKHWNHLRLLQLIMEEGIPAKVERAGSLKEVFELLRACPSFGDFLAFQYTIDLNYSEMLHFSEMDFVVAGPGAKGGLAKCFADTGGLEVNDVIKAVTDMAESEFDRLGLPYTTLWGRPLHPIDCQNLFCEVDKYARVVHPEYTARNGRTRIKQRFSPNPCSLTQWYPPKWKLRFPSWVKSAKALHLVEELPFAKVEETQEQGLPLGA